MQRTNINDDKNNENDDKTKKKNQDENGYNHASRILEVIKLYEGLES